MNPLSLPRNRSSLPAPGVSVEQQVVVVVPKVKFSVTGLLHPLLVLVLPPPPLTGLKLFPQQLVPLNLPIKLLFQTFRQM